MRQACEHEEKEQPGRGARAGGSCYRSRLFHISLDLSCKMSEGKGRGEIRSHGLLFFLGDRVARVRSQLCARSQRDSGPRGPFELFSRRPGKLCAWLSATAGNRLRSDPLWRK